MLDFNVVFYGFQINLTEFLVQKLFPNWSFHLFVCCFKTGKIAEIRGQDDMMWMCNLFLLLAFTSGGGACGWSVCRRGSIETLSEPHTLWGFAFLNLFQRHCGAGRKRKFKFSFLTDTEYQLQNNRCNGTFNLS